MVTLPLALHTVFKVHQDGRLATRHFLGSSIQIKILNLIIVES